MFWKITSMIFFILTIHVYINASTLPSKKKRNSVGPMKVVIDTDAGGDDAVALLLALATPEVEVIAITCSYGNTEVANVENNVLKTLAIANRSNIPVYSGAGKPFIEKFVASDYFGKDGFGDFIFEGKIGSVDRSKHASIAMVELSNKYPGELNILNLGPLTNVALAASLDPSFTQNVHRFYVMGSWFNTGESEPQEPVMEFNFSLDPESNAIFLNSTTQHSSLIASWHLAHHNTISLDWRKNTLGTLNSEKVRFLNKAERVVLEKLKEWEVADSITAAAMIWPELIIESTERDMRAVLHGPFRGTVVLGENDKDGKNVEIIEKFNVDAFKDKLLKYLA